MKGYVDMGMVAQTLTGLPNCTCWCRAGRGCC
jgi:hypothetical protein